MGKWVIRRLFTLDNFNNEKLQSKPKISSLRIVDKIHEMYEAREIDKLEDGWMKITDMLRA